MQTRHVCRHEHARFHSMQRLGQLPAVELWQCPECRSTVSAESLGKSRSNVFAATL